MKSESREERTSGVHGLDADDELGHTPSENVVADSNSIAVVSDHLGSEFTSVAEFHQEIQEVFVLWKQSNSVDEKIS